MAPNDSGEEPNAEMLSRAFGTNTKYIYQCNVISRTSPNVLQLVLNGERTVSQAIELLEEMQKEAEVKEAKQEKEASVVCDAMGSPVPADLVEIFDSKKDFTGIAKAIRSLKLLIEEMTEASAGYFLDDSIPDDLTRLASTVKSSKPYIICPYCSAGQVQENGVTAPCGQCKGQSFLTKFHFDMISEEDRKKYGLVKPQKGE